MKLARIDATGATEAFAAWRAALDGLSKLTGGGLAVVSKEPAGPVVRAPKGGGRWVKLAGSGNPYTVTPVYATASGGWTDLPGGADGMPGYEANAVTGLGGKVVRAEQTAAGDWRFAWRRTGAGCGQICVTVINPCGNVPIGAGATVTVKQGATVIGTCVTDETSSCCVPIAAAGAYSYFADPPATAPGLARSPTTTFAATCTTNSRTATLQTASGYGCPGPCSHNPVPQASDLEVDDSVVGNTPYAGGGFYPWSKTWTWPGCVPDCVYVTPPQVTTGYRFNCDNSGLSLVGVYYSTFGTGPTFCPDNGGVGHHDREFFLAKTSETSSPFSMTFGGGFVDSSGNPLPTTSEQYKVATQLYCGVSPVVTLS